MSHKGIGNGGSIHGSWLMAHGFMTSLILVGVSAILFVLSFPPFYVWPAMPVSVGLLTFMAVEANSGKRAVGVVMGAQFLMWLWIQRWMIEVTVVGWPGLALFLSLYGVLYVGLVRWIGRSGRTGGLPMTVVVPVVWTGVEFLRGGIVMNGYPWFLAGHPMVEQTMLVQSADLFGAYFISFLVAMVGGLLVDGLRWRQGNCCGKRLVLYGCAVGIIVIGNYGYGMIRQFDKQGEKFRGLAIQTNLGQSNKIKWSREDQEKDFASFVRQTEEALAASGNKPDLIIWPETMVPGFGLDEETLSFLETNGYVPGRQYFNALRGLGERSGVPLLVGSSCTEGLAVVGGKPIWDARYNSAYLIDGSGETQRYDKVFLTPFGETMPYISNWDWLEEKLLAFGAGGMSFDLDAAEQPRILEVNQSEETIPIATPVCYEDTVPWLCRKMVYEKGRKRVRVLVNISNDGWFGEHDAGRAQHVQISRFRCIENRVPMIRCANTGLSVAIDSFGNVIGRVGEGRYGSGRVAGSLAATVIMDDRETLYGRIGDLWAWGCLLGTIALFGGCRFNRKRTLQKESE